VPPPLLFVIAALPAVLVRKNLVTPPLLFVMVALPAVLASWK
jgi:hypothetical protein